MRQDQGSRRFTEWVRKHGADIFMYSMIVLFLAELTFFFFFFSTDETEDEALPAEVYRERKNRDYLISILCIDGYRYIVRGKSFRDAVQVWENGPDGPRLSQCPRKSDAAAVPKAPAEPDMKDAPDAQGR